MQPLTEGTFKQLEGELEMAAGAIPDASIEGAGELYEQFVENMRPHAILYLLIDAKPEMFFQDLIVSGYAWRHYLRRCAEASFRDYCSALSRADSFFDAVAGAHIPLALEIFDLAPAEWMQGDEYEEDFCWVRFLGLLARKGNGAGAELDALLDRFEKALQGVPSGRLEVCQALRAEDREAFEIAFESLIADWQQACAGMALRAEEEATVAAGTQVFVEGLAVLRLAEQVGIRTALAFKGCPPLARRARKRPPIEDPFAP